MLNVYLLPNRGLLLGPVFPDDHSRRSPGSVENELNRGKSTSRQRQHALNSKACPYGSFFGDLHRMDFLSQ